MRLLQKLSVNRLSILRIVGNYDWLLLRVELLWISGDHLALERPCRSDHVVGRVGRRRGRIVPTNIT